MGDPHTPKYLSLLPYWLSIWLVGCLPLNSSNKSNLGNRDRFNPSRGKFNPSRGKSNPSRGNKVNLKGQLRDSNLVHQKMIFPMNLEIWESLRKTYLA